MPETNNTAATPRHGAVSREGLGSKYPEDTAQIVDETGQRALQPGGDAVDVARFHIRTLND